MVFCNIIHEQAPELFASHNPYFNRWFSAIYDTDTLRDDKECHNPYFNRWFSAMNYIQFHKLSIDESQSLF